MSWFVHLHADVSVLLRLTVSLYVCLSMIACVCLSVGLFKGQLFTSCHMPCCPILLLLNCIVIVLE